MDNLLSFSTPVLDNAQSVENLLRRSANLRKLSCILREPWQCPSLDFLSQLESLKVFYYGMIEVKLCGNEATGLAWQIQEEQNDMGNEQLKVLITHPKWSSGAFSQEP
ncbi:hypothetical protein K7X08_001245 [Anisodus acutangulus]|uniref:Uncharacterized protein n=1 Tax=Anisodus acutangulus TaxID=402998 RepID=A0A9Q1RKF2_9SOLA|nr:hypothetical protein K7X08_001245 [Anisodus acutangulus]